MCFLQWCLCPEPSNKYLQCPLGTTALLVGRSKFQSLSVSGACELLAATPLLPEDTILSSQAWSRGVLPEFSLPVPVPVARFSLQADDSDGGKLIKSPLVRWYMCSSWIHEHHMSLHLFRSYLIFFNNVFYFTYTTVPLHVWFCFLQCQLAEVNRNLEADNPPSDPLSEGE